jgi:hypothetical protein
MTTIPIINNKKEIVGYAVIDESDYTTLSKFSWSLSHGYAVSELQSMHKMLIGDVPKDHVIDHINNDKLDNRKCNLRIATRSQNSQNKQKRQNTSSKFIGVTKFDGKYNASGNGFGHLGRYDKEEDAAKQYDIYTYLTHGEHAKTNNTISFADASKYTLESLKTKVKERELPKHVFRRDNGSIYIQITHRKTKLKKTFNTIAEAVIFVDNLKKTFDEIDKKEAKMKTCREIERNIDGIAVIKIKEYEILVDDDRWHELTKYTWSLKNEKYASGVVNGLRMSLHQYVLGKVDGKIVDHINRNTFDNRIANLRHATHSENNQNRATIANSTSIYKGVLKINNSSDKIWRVNISYENKRYYCGCYSNEQDAGKAYNAKVIELYGCDSTPYLNVFKE